MSGEKNVQVSEHPFQDDIRRMATVPTIVVGILASALAVWGLWDSMRDATGDRHGLTLAMAAPCLFVAWVLISFLWQRKEITSLLARIILGCLVAPLPVVLVAMVALLVMWFIPGNQEAIASSAAANHGFQYHWDDTGLGQFLALYFFGGYAIAASVGLGVVLVVLMPIVSIVAPRVAAAGSHLEKVGDVRFRNNLTGQLFVGLGLLILGLVFAIMLADGRSFEDLPSWIDSFTRYEWSGYDFFGDDWDREMTFWAVGVLLIAAGIGLMAFPLVATIIARVRFAEGGGAEGQGDDENRSRRPDQRRS